MNQRENILPLTVAVVISVLLHVGAVGAGMEWTWGKGNSELGSTTSEGNNKDTPETQKDQTRTQAQTPKGVYAKLWPAREAAEAPSEATPPSAELLPSAKQIVREAAQRRRQEPYKLRLGSDNGTKAATVSWISYDDFRKLMGVKGTTQQPALQTKAEPLAGASLTTFDATPPAPPPGRSGGRAGNGGAPGTGGAGGAMGAGNAGPTGSPMASAGGEDVIRMQRPANPSSASAQGDRGNAPLVLRPAQAGALANRGAPAQGPQAVQAAPPKAGAASPAALAQVKPGVDAPHSNQANHQEQSVKPEETRADKTQPARPQPSPMLATASQPPRPQTSAPGGPGGTGGPPVIVPPGASSDGKGAVLPIPGTGAPASATATGAKTTAAPVKEAAATPPPPQVSASKLVSPTTQATQKGGPQLALLTPMPASPGAASLQPAVTAQPTPGASANSSSPTSTGFPGNSGNPGPAGAPGSPASAGEPGSPGTPGAGGQPSNPTGAPRSDKESIPVSLTTDRVMVVPGGVLTQEGIEIKTVHPRFSPVELASSLPGNIDATVTFSADGTVIDVHLERRSGYADIDSVVIESLYMWKASGRKVRELHHSFIVPFRIILSDQE